MNQDAKSDTQNATSRAPMPSGFWCVWQSLKGLNPRRLSIPDADLRNKWVIITGGNSGIGREAALQYARWGANIVLGCREPPPHEPHPDVIVRECQAAARDSDHQSSMIKWWLCDMARLSSVQAFGERWLATGRPLDILANNAGMAGRGDVIELTEDGFEVVHQVNFLSHVFLTMLLLPAIKKAPKPRIVCTTSCAQYGGQFKLEDANKTSSYANNKLYFQTWLTEFQDRMMQQADCEHITIVGVHPGFVRTNIWVSNLGAGQTAWTQHGALGKLEKYLGMDAQQGSLAITYAATCPERNAS